MERIPAFCGMECFKNKSWACVQRKFRTNFSKQPLDRRAILQWYAKFKEVECWCSRKRMALQQKRSKEFEHLPSEPRKSIERASREFEMPSTTVWRVVRKRLHMIPYKMHLLQHVKDIDKSTREDLYLNAGDVGRRLI